MREFTGLSDAALRSEVFARKTPALLRGLIDAWPAVEYARRSSEALLAYLHRFDQGALVDAVMTAPQMAGRLFYDAAMDGFNFHRNRLPLSAVAEQVLRYAQFPTAPAVAAQSALLSECLPGFSAENRLTSLAGNVQPRIWLGNRITTPAHVDEWNNIGCVVGGGRDALRCFRRNRSPISTSARSTSHPPARR